MRSRTASLLVVGVLSIGFTVGMAGAANAAPAQPKDIVGTAMGMAGSVVATAVGALGTATTVAGGVLDTATAAAGAVVGAATGLLG
jgi:hypothetical protein